MASNRVERFSDGVAKNNHGADLKFAVDAGKHAAAKINPGRDASAQNLAKALRGKWSDGRLPTQHPRGQ